MVHMLQHNPYLREKKHNFTLDKLKPDVCLLDISMPIMNGIEAAIQLKKRGSTAKVIFVTMHEDRDFIQAALRIGASGYVFKQRITSDLKLAVSEALADRIFISPTYV